MMVKLIMQVVLASADLAGRAKGTGRPAEPDFALVANIGIIVIRSAKSLFVEKDKNQGKILNTQYSQKLSQQHIIENVNTRISSKKEPFVILELKVN